MTALAAALVLAAGCTGGVHKATGVGAKPAPEVVPEQETPAPPAPTWPLTGLEAGAGEEFGPVLSVKVENSPSARPQAGLEHADVVWEQLVEGGLTRFLAMYHSDLPGEVGPIRSVRAMDAAIAGPVGGVFAFSGGFEEYVWSIRAAGILTASDDAGDPGFYRVPDRRREHSLFGDPGRFLAAGGGQEPPAPMFAFAAGDDAPTAEAAGQAAGRVTLRFPASTPSWEWTGTAWARHERGQPALAASGRPLEAANVVVLRVTIRDTGRRDGAGARVPETVLTGEGPAAVFTAGHVVEGTWEKGGPTEALVLKAGGEEVLLAPGTTWVELLPTTGGLAVS